MAQLFYAITALVAWAGLSLEFYVITTTNSASRLPLAILDYFSFFTILSNVFVALSLTIPWLAPNSALGRFCARTSTRAAVVLYIMVTGLIYVFLLRGLPLPPGVVPSERMWLINACLHYATPLLSVLGWLFFAPKGTLKWSSALVWLIFPLLYGAYILLVRGPLSGFYPYPFIDVAALGMERVLWNIAALLVFFLGLGLLLVAIDRGLGRFSRSEVKLAD